MSLTPFNDNIKLNAPKALDQRTGKFFGGLWLPYADVAEANATINPAYRARGLTVQIVDSGITTEYWYRDGVLDSDLIRKGGNPINTLDTPSLVINGDGSLATPLSGDVQLSLFSNNAIQLFSDGLYAPQTIRQGVVFGGIVTWLKDYDYNISAAGYYINGVFYTSPSTNITLSAPDGTFNRIDTFIVDNTGTASVLQGTPSADPAQAALDPAIQLELSIALVETGTTQPTIATECIYLENTEWTTAASAGTINPASTSSPCTGTKSVEGTNVLNGTNISFTRASVITPATNYSILKFSIKSKGAFGGGPGTPKKRKLVFQFRNGVTLIGNSVTIINGAYGFDDTNTTDCQNIAIPLTDFGLTTSTAIDNLLISVGGLGLIAGFWLDDMCFQGTPLPPPPLTIVITADSGASISSPNNIQFGSSLSTGSPLLHHTFLYGASTYTLNLNDLRFQPDYGAAVAAANNLTLGLDGNTFPISGATQINAITTANWQAGSVIYLKFASTPTVKHNTAGGAGTAPISLAGGIDFVAGAGDMITLNFDGTSWNETARKVAATGSGIINIYNSNGTLSSGRTVSFGGNSMYFDALSGGAYSGDFGAGAGASGNSSSFFIGQSLVRFLKSNSSNGGKSYVSMPNNVAVLGSDSITGTAQEMGANVQSGATSGHADVGLYAWMATDGTWTTYSQHIIDVTYSGVNIHMSGNIYPNLNLQFENLPNTVTANVLYYNSSNGLITYGAVPAVTAYTSDNGITKTSFNFQLGGTLLHDTTIDTTTAFGLFITGARAGGPTLKVTNTGGTGNACEFNGGGGRAISAYTTGGQYACEFVSVDGAAVNMGATGTGAGARVYVTASGYRQNLIITSYAAAANGNGSSIDFEAYSSAGGRSQGRLGFDWVDKTDASRTSEFLLSGVNNGVTVNWLNITGLGIITLPQGLSNYANDGAAATGGIPVNGFYRNGSAVQIRVT